MSSYYCFARGQAAKALSLNQRYRVDAAAKLEIEKVSGMHTRGMEISLLILVRSFHASGLQGKHT